MSRVSALLVEVHRRGVTSLALGYASVAFVVYQAGDLLIVRLQLSLDLGASMLGVLVFGLPLILVLSGGLLWMSDRRRRTEGHVERWLLPTKMRRWVHRTALGMALVGLSLWWLKPVDGPVLEGTEVVVVLPFAVAGDGLNHLVEGLPDLFALALEGTGAIRTPNSRLVARELRRAGRPGEDDVSSALDIGRAVGAGSVLRGSATRSAEGLDLSVILMRTDGRQVVAARVEGPDDDLLALVDSLANELIQRVWRSRGEPPRSDLRAVTTSDVQGLNLYLRGEALFRRGQWRAAANAFSRATDADSTFALANARLADTYGWADGVFTENATASTASAYRFLDRLPDRRRRLILARFLAAENIGDLSSVQLIEAHLNSFPDDLEALHVLAEIRFHQRPLFGLGIEELMDPVERLLAVDSTMTEGLVHPIEVALQFGDRTRFDRYLSLAEATGLRTAPELRRAGAALWDDPTSRATVARELMVDVGSAFTYTVGSYRVDAGRPTDFVDGLDAVLSLVPAERKVALWRTRSALLTSMGYLAAAADTARLDVVPTEVVRAQLTDYPALAGFVDPSVIRQGVDPQGGGRDGSPRWNLDLLEAVAQLAVGDGPAGRAALDNVDVRSAPDSLRSVVAGLVEAAHGWAVLLDGDTAAGIAGLKNGLRTSGRWSEAGVNTTPVGGLGISGAASALSFRLVATMASWGPAAEEGRRLLRDVLWPDLHYEVLRHYEMGRSLEQMGETVDARRSYLHFLKLLDGADQGLLVADEVAWAEESVVRLAR